MVFCVWVQIFVTMDFAGDASPGFSLIFLGWVRPTTCCDYCRHILERQFICAYRNTSSSLFLKHSTADGMHKITYYLQFLNIREVLHIEVGDAAEFSEFRQETDFEMMILVRLFLHSRGLELLFPIDKIYEEI